MTDSAWLLVPKSTECYRDVNLILWKHDWPYCDEVSRKQHVGLSHVDGRYKCPSAQPCVARYHFCELDVKQDQQQQQQPCVAASRIFKSPWHPEDIKRDVDGVADTTDSKLSVLIHSSYHQVAVVIAKQCLISYRWGAHRPTISIVTDSSQWWRSPSGSAGVLLVIAAWLTGLPSAEVSKLLTVI